MVGPSPLLSAPPHLGEADAMLARHMLSEVRLYHHHSTLSAAYLQPLPLPKRFSFSCCPSLLHLLPPIYLDETWCVDHGLGLLNICFHSHSAKNFHRHRHFILDPLVIPSRYPNVIGVKDQVPLSNLLSQTVMGLLGSTDRIK